MKARCHFCEAHNANKLTPPCPSHQQDLEEAYYAAATVEFLPHCDEATFHARRDAFLNRKSTSLNIYEAKLVVIRMKLEQSRKRVEILERMEKETLRHANPPIVKPQFKNVEELKRAVERFGTPEFLDSLKEIGQAMFSAIDQVENELHSDERTTVT